MAEIRGSLHYKVFYSRVSTTEQNEERQLQSLEGFNKVLIEKYSGTIPLFERPKGSQIKKMIDDGKLTHLEVHSIDRLGRELISVLEVWNYLTEKGIVLTCRNPQIRNFDENGKVDTFGQLLMSVISIMSDFEKKMIRERQMEGIQVRKLKGLYMGRKFGSVETNDKFLNKPKNQEIIKFLKEARLSYSEISKVVGCSQTTIVKVKKMISQTY